MFIISSRYVRRFFSFGMALTLFLAVTMTTAPTTTRAAGCSQPFCAIDVGKYWINNNLWGQSSGSGWQAIWDTYLSGSTMGWGTNWSWTGQSNQVKSYSSVVLGWHWGWRRSGTGLPVQISANRNVNTGWNYSVSQSGTMNVAYDCWLHTISNPSYNNNPSDEVMIWLYRAGGAGPLGTYQATVNLAGTSWDLYRGNIGWNVFSFIRRTNATNQTLNIGDFLNHLVSRGWVSNSKYLTSVEAGTEVFIGNGRVDTNSYYCNVQ